MHGQGKQVIHPHTPHAHPQTHTTRTHLVEKRRVLEKGCSKGKRNKKKDGHKHKKAEEREREKKPHHEARIVTCYPPMHALPGLFSVAK